MATKKETKKPVNEKYVIPEYAQEILDSIKDPEAKLRYKISIARKLFKDQHKTKSGQNTFQRFDYFEQKDIEPDAIEIALLLDLQYDFLLGKRRMVLTVYDCKTKASVKYPLERPQIQLSGNLNQQLQDIGKIRTYLERYCIMDWLRVVEPDTVDSEDNSKSVKPKKTLNKQIPTMTTKETKKYLQDNLKDPTDMVEAKKMVDQLKLENKLNQPVYNQMCKIIRDNSKGDKQ